MEQRLKILIVTHNNLFPVDSGGAMATMSYVDELRKYHEVSVLITNPFVPSTENLVTLKEKWPNVKLYCGNPSDQKRFAFRALAKNILTRLGILKPLVFTNEENAQFKYEPLPQGDIELVNKALSENDFDIIEVNFVEKFPLIFNLPKESLKVAVNHEPRFRRTMVQTQNNLLDEKYGAYLKKYQFKFENDLMNLFDAVVCLNPTDQTLISESIEKPVFLAPVSAAWEDFDEIKEENTAIENILFLGGGLHDPNRDALDWFLNNVAKQLYKRLGKKIQVVGEWPLASQKTLKSPYAQFLGFVEDLDVFAKNSVMVVPIRIGGGIRTKIQWAMSKGIPVVSTTFGCEGIPCKNGEHFLLANTAEDFIKSIQILLENTELRTKLRKSANKLAREHYSPKKVVEVRTKIYHQLVSEKLVLE
ncbi:MAG: glycosyltransferase involved in cell wall biosynthesis [Arcticibacterium sp.]|jgi:glycosyltransferase involved in cell wall biosynthesis